MTDLPALSPDQPELRTLCQLAGIAPSRLAAAFNDPEHLFSHISRDELERFMASCQRLDLLQRRLIAALGIMTVFYDLQVKMVKNPDLGLSQTGMWRDITSAIQGATNALSNFNSMIVGAQGNAARLRGFLTGGL